MINVQNQLWKLLYDIQLFFFFSYVKTERFSFIKNINEYQFHQYECRAENILGSKSDYIYIEQSK